MSSSKPLSITKAQGTPKVPRGCGGPVQDNLLPPTGWLTAPDALALYCKQMVEDDPSRAADDLSQALAAGEIQFQFCSVKSAQPMQVDSQFWRTNNRYDLWRGGCYRINGIYDGFVPYIKEASLLAHVNRSPNIATTGTSPKQTDKDFLISKFKMRPQPSHTTLYIAEAKAWAGELLGPSAKEEDVKKKAKSLQAQARMIS